MNLISIWIYIYRYILNVIVGNFPSDVSIIHFIKRFPNGPKQYREPHEFYIYIYLFIYFTVLPDIFYEQWGGRGLSFSLFTLCLFVFYYFVILFNLFILATKRKKNYKKPSVTVFWFTPNILGDRWTENWTYFMTNCFIHKIDVNLYVTFMPFNYETIWMVTRYSV